MSGCKDCERCKYYYSYVSFCSDYGPECHNPYLERMKEKFRPDPYNCEFFDDKDGDPKPVESDWDD
jgi:hypothetical protein